MLESICKVERKLKLAAIKISIVYKTPSNTYILRPSSHKRPVGSEKGGSDSFLKVQEQQWESHVGVVGKVGVLHQRRNYGSEGWAFK